MAPPPRVLVVGSGPAGLSAGVHLLEGAGKEVAVDLVTLGHHAGGKAGSWRDKDGFSVDHGFHAVFGFYSEMRALAQRSGVDLDAALVSNRGVSTFWDPVTGERHDFKAAHNPLVMAARAASAPGLSGEDRRALATAVARMARTMARTGDLERLDEVCFKAWLLEHGAPASFLGHPFHRQVEELLFNAPFEVSTYVVQRGVQLIQHCYYDALYSYVAGGLTEKFWEPIAERFVELGGVLQVRKKLVRLEHDGRRLSAGIFAVPDNEVYHKCGMHAWPVQVPVLAGSESREAFDAMICTLPAACFVELNPGDRLWDDPFFGNVKKLRSVSTISLQVWTKGASPAPARGTVASLPLPLSYVVDYKPLVPEFAADARYGGAFEWVGAEAGWEDVPDADLMRSARAALGRVPGYEGTEESEVVHQVLRRNRANHQRYLLTEPGTLRFRPTVETPLEGLYLAGDWVRNEVDIPTMEGAIRCGKRAAEIVLRKLSR